MKSFVRLLLMCVVSLMSLTVSANEYSVDNIPMVHLWDANRYVSNPDGILSPETVNAMDALLAQLQDSLTIECAVVVAESFDEDCWDIGTKLIRKYGIGKKDVSNGLVITLGTKDRCLAFATGDGMEGVMPDAICHNIQTKYMNPFLKEERWDEGMLSGVRAVCEYLQSNGDESIIGEESEELSGSDWLQILCLIFIGPVTWLVYMIIVSPLTLYRLWKYRECPRCGKHYFKLVEVKKKNNAEVRHCSKCDCEHEQMHKALYISLAAWSYAVYRFILSALARGGGSGGGRHGGSYGGGTSSGGGSRSRF